MYPKSFSTLFVALFVMTTVFTSCSPSNDGPNPTEPPTFPVLPEDNTGSRARSITYVYDKTAVDASYPPKIDSSIILFSYNAAGKIDSLRLIHNNAVIYDFQFERNGSNKLTAIRSRTWVLGDTGIHKFDFVLEHNASGNVSRMKRTWERDPTEVDSFIVKSTGSRIDSVIDYTYALGINHIDKYAYTYNGSGDITQVDHTTTSGIFFTYLNIYKFTISASPAAAILGDDAIFWYFFAIHSNISTNNKYLVPPVLFHSAKQPSKLVLQAAAEPIVTHNYQTEYYGNGKPKKMTANVTTAAGAHYEREAYYYTYAQ